MRKEKEKKFGELNPRSHRESVKDKYLAARLLSRKNNVTIQEKELVLQNVLRQLPKIDGAQTELRPIRGVGQMQKLAVIGAMAALCALGLVLWLRIGDESETHEFAAKGDGTSSFLEVHCLNDDGGTSCVAGSRLTFAFSHLPADSFFSAFAIRESDDLAIWMFPAQKNGTSRAVSKDVKALSEAIVLDDLYPPGMYEIVGILSDHALTRAEVRSLIRKGAQQGTEKKGTSGGNTITSISRVKIHVASP